MGQNRALDLISKVRDVALYTLTWLRISVYIARSTHHFVGKAKACSNLPYALAVNAVEGCFEIDERHRCEAVKRVSLLQILS